MSQSPSRAPEASPDASGPGSCPLCDLAMVEKYRGIPAEETGALFSVDECPQCGLGQTRPHPRDLAPYYTPTYYGGRHGLTSRFCTRRRLRLLRRWAGPPAGRSLLDFGCGDGPFLLDARSQGWNVAGVERNPPASAGFPIVSNLDDLHGQTFDCITVWHVMEHLEAPLPFLRRLRNHMNPGALLLLAVPNLASFQSRAAGASWLALDIPRHLFHYTPDSLAKALQAGGFALQELSYGELEYDVIGWSQSLLNRRLGGRNEFFKAMSGRPSNDSPLRKALQVPLGLGLSLLAAPLAWAESKIARGGTLLAAARTT